MIWYKIIHLFSIEITWTTSLINSIAPGMNKKILPGSKTRDQRVSASPLSGLHAERFGPSLPFQALRASLALRILWPEMALQFPQTSLPLRKKGPMKSDLFYC